MDPPHDILALLPDSEPIKSIFRSVEMKYMLDSDLWGTHAQIRMTIVLSGNLSWTLPRITILFVRCRGNGDFTTVKTMYEKQFSSLEKQELDQLIKPLRKVGLCFAE
jgi:hypothetical protein